MALNNFHRFIKVAGMVRAVGLLVLLLVGLLLRRILGLYDSSGSQPRGLQPLDPEREEIYAPVARELETQTSILAISLNDAFAERDAGQDDIACRLVQLSVSEWRRVGEILEALLNSVSKYMTSVELVIPTHSIVARRFKSSLMSDHFRFHELLDQLVFRSKLRFQLQIRLLRRAAETLTIEFRRTSRYLDQTHDDSEEVWRRLDLYFHDFDLITREALLAFRALLGCLPQPLLADFGAGLQAVIEHGVRSTNPKVDR